MFNKFEHLLSGVSCHVDNERSSVGEGNCTNFIITLVKGYVFKSNRERRQKFDNYQQAYYALKNVVKA